MTGSFSVLLTELFRNISGDKTKKLKNWKTVFYGESLPGCLWKKQFFSFSVLLTEVFRNISGDKTKKLKNCFFMENLSLDLSGKNSFLVFQFCLGNSSGTFPETKLKNWKTEKLFFMENLSLDVSGKNSFSVFQFCLRKYSGTFPETKLKNWKTVFLWRISPWISLEKTVFQFFSFSVLLTELFRRQN